MKHKYSLWAEFASFQSTVDALAHEVGNPTFVPHMTLAANLFGDAESLMPAVEDLAQKQHPFEVEFGGFGTQHREHRFFCLLARPSQSLDVLYEAVTTVFPSVSEETFRQWPHVSLMYGTEKATAKYPTIELLKTRFGDGLNGPVKLDNLALWSTEGETGDWRSIARFELKS